MSKKCCFVSFALLIFSFAAVEAQIMFDRRIQPGYNYQSYNNYFQFTAGYRFEREMKLQSKSKTSIRRKR